MKIIALSFLAAGALQMNSFSQALRSPSMSVPVTGASDDAKARQEQVDREEQARIHAKWNVSVDLQMVALEEARALELIPRLQSRDQAKADTAWNQLQAMIKTKEATLVAWPIVRTTDGSLAVSETILEQRYPTEFEPPQQPQTFSPPMPTPGHVNAATVESTPNAFETRNAGVTLEVDPMVLGEGKCVYLRFTSSRVELLGTEDFGKALTVHNTLVAAPQPIFLSLKSDLDLILPSGQRQLIAVHKLTKPANFIEFHFVHAVVTKSE